MSKCAHPVCHEIAKSSCSSYAREQYCSNNCQKLDWKTHKSMCPILKKLSNKKQPFEEVVGIIKEIQASKKGNDLRVLKSFAIICRISIRKRSSRDRLS
jgi:hypothetical protein